MKPQRSLKGRALALLAQRDQSRVELRRKLLRHAFAEDEAIAAAAADSSAAPAVDSVGAPTASSAGTPAAARVDALLDWLEAQRFLSQQRFAESRVHARAPRFGNLRIRLELAQHQVVLSAEAAQALADSELERARAVRARKFPQSPLTVAERARQTRFLGVRGFSADVVRRVMREATGRDAAADRDPGEEA